MSRTDEDQAAREAQAFRPSTRPFAIAVAANFLLAALCLGVPYLRGRMHAKESLVAFARFAACVYGGRARATLGLGLPASADAQFASEFMRAGADWPGRCRPALDAALPPEAIFVWPSVKQAGAEVRAVVPLVRRELDAVERSRAAGGSRRVPRRMLAAVERFRAGLALLARAAGADETLDDDAVAFAHAPALAEPARLPLYAGASAALSVRPGEDGLEAVALDGGGISWLRVEHGRVERRRLARSSLVRAVIRDGDRAYVVWAMPPDRCAEREDRCVQRAMGIANFDGRAEKLPAPTWLAAHPAGRVDRAVRPHGAGEVDVLALHSAQGELEVRRFALGAQTPAAGTKAEGKPPPRGPIARWPLPAVAADALLFSDAAVYAVAADGASTAFLWPYANAAGESTDAPPAQLSTLAGTRAWLAACDAERVRWLVHGTETALAVSRADASGATATLPNVGLEIADPIHPDDPEHDRVRLLCTSDALSLLALDASNTLFVARCDAARCGEPHEIASDVAGFAAAAAGDALVVATTGNARPEIAVLRVDARGAPAGAAVTPSVCWDPLGGMCGRPTLVGARGRLVLGARDGADLLALESLDAGTTWTAMRGLKVSGAGDADAVMRQHRARHMLE